MLEDQNLARICEDILTLEKHIQGKEEEAAVIKREKSPEKDYETLKKSTPGE